MKPIYVPHAFPQDKSKKVTSYAIGTSPLNARIDRTTKYHQRYVPPNAQHGPQVVTEVKETQSRALLSQNSASSRAVLVSATHNTNDASSSGWNTRAIGGAICVTAYALPVVAASATAAIGYGALATTAILVSNTISNNQRAIRESDSEVLRHEVSTGGDVRRYELDVKAGVGHRMIDEGHTPGNGGKDTLYLGNQSGGMIEL